MSAIHFLTYHLVWGRILTPACLNECFRVHIGHLLMQSKHEGVRYRRQRSNVCVSGCLFRQYKKQENKHGTYIYHMYSFSQQPYLGNTYCQYFVKWSYLELSYDPDWHAIVWKMWDRIQILHSGSSWRQK